MTQQNPHIPIMTAVLELSAAKSGMTYEQLISAAQYQALDNIMRQRQVRHINKKSGQKVSFILQDNDMRYMTVRYGLPPARLIRFITILNLLRINRFTPSVNFPSFPRPVRGFFRSDRMLFLSKDEMAELTGYRHTKKQVEVLRKRGIAFFLNGRGQPKVSRTLIESGGKAPKPAKEAPVWQPAALRQPSK